MINSRYVIFLLNLLHLICEANERSLKRISELVLVLNVGPAMVLEWTLETLSLQRICHQVMGRTVKKSVTFQQIYM